jgi:hypothetical protein
VTATLQAAPMAMYFAIPPPFLPRAKFRHVGFAFSSPARSGGRFSTQLAPAELDRNALSVFAMSVPVLRPQNWIETRFPFFRGPYLKRHKRHSLRRHSLRAPGAILYGLISRILIGEYIVYQIFEFWGLCVEFYVENFGLISRKLTNRNFMYKGSRTSK